MEKLVVAYSQEPSNLILESYPETLCLHGKGVQGVLSVYLDKVCSLFFFVLLVSRMKEPL